MRFMRSRLELCIVNLHLVYDDLLHTFILVGEGELVDRGGLAAAVCGEAPHSPMAATTRTGACT